MSQLGSLRNRNYTGRAVWGTGLALIAALPLTAHAQGRIPRPSTPASLPSQGGQSDSKTQQSQPAQQQSRPQPQQVAPAPVVRPSAPVVLPSQNVQLPRQNYSLPNQNYQLPNQNVQLPRQNVPLPNQNYQLPNQNVQLPNQNYRLPNQNEQLPRQNYRLPNQNQLLPNQNAQLPRHNYRLPNQNAQLPNQNYQLPSHNIPLPSHNVNVPRTQLPESLPYNSSTYGNNVYGSYGSSTTIVSGNGTTYVRSDRTLYFPGYVYQVVPDLTCVAPFGTYYYGAPYIQSAYAITTPYPYIGGYDVTVVHPYTEADPYVSADEERAVALRATLNDLSRAWEENDFRSLRRRVAPDVNVAVFQNERYLYSLRRADFLALVADALDRVQTLSFRLTAVRARNDGLVNAYGVHRYRVRGAKGSGDTVRRSTRIRATLIQIDGDWYVSAISLSPDAVR